MSEKKDNREYEIDSYEFKSEQFLTDTIFYMIHKLRLDNINEIIQNCVKFREIFDYFIFQINMSY